MENPLFGKKTPVKITVKLPVKEKPITELPFQQWYSIKGAQNELGFFAFCIVSALACLGLYFATPLPMLKPIISEQGLMNVMTIFLFLISTLSIVQLLMFVFKRPSTFIANARVAHPKLLMILLLLCIAVSVPTMALCAF